MKTCEYDVGGTVRLPKQFYERPLALEEGRFASEHISIVYRCLRQQGLNSDEWFDVVIFRYLLDVRRYSVLPELQELKFITVACSAVRPAVRHERRKQASRLITVSLFDVIPDTKDLCYINTIAAPKTN